MEILTVNTSKGNLRCAKCCGGPRSLIMLPGVSITSVLDSAAAVEAAYRAFNGKYTIYLFEYPGEYPEGAEIRYLADMIAEAVRNLRLEKCCLFGASFGGMVGQVLLAGQPELFVSAVLASTVSQLTEASPDTLSRWHAIAANGDVRSLNLAFYDAVYSEELQISMAKMIRSMLDNGDQKDCDAMAVHTRMMLRADLRDCAGNIKAGTLVIGARDDRVFSYKDIVETARRIGAELYLYEGSSHAVFDEAPDFRQRMLDHFGAAE